MLESQKGFHPIVMQDWRCKNLWQMIVSIINDIQLYSISLSQISIDQRKKLILATWKGTNFSAILTETTKKTCQLFVGFQTSQELNLHQFSKTFPLKLFSSTLCYQRHWSNYKTDPESYIFYKMCKRKKKRGKNLVHFFVTYSRNTYMILQAISRFIFNGFLACSKCRTQWNF